MSDSIDMDDELAAKAEQIVVLFQELTLREAVRVVALLMLVFANISCNDKRNLP